MNRSRIDPVLKQLLADVEGAEIGIPLTLYLPSGVLSGHTTTHYDFAEYSNVQIENYSKGGVSVVADNDDDYVHLGFKLDPDAGEDSPLTVVRVNLADVVAWRVK